MEIIKIYDKDFTELGICAGYTYLRYTREFRDAGQAVVKLPSASSVTELFRPDGYIFVPDGTMYIIRAVEKDLVRGEVTVRCKGLLDFFGGSATGEEFTMSGDVATLLCALARRGAENMPAPLSAEAVLCGRDVTFEGGRSYLLPDMVSLCYLGGIGMSLEYTGSGFVFAPVFPEDRTKGSADPVALSWDLGGFSAKRTLADFGEYRNEAVVSGTEKESGGRYIVRVNADSVDMSDSFPDSEHFKRQILVNYTAPVTPYMKIDGMGEKYFDEAEYLADMRLAGAAALGRCRPRLTLYGSIPGEDVSPGDIVTVSDHTSGINAAALAERTVTEYSGGEKKTYTELSADAVL